MSSAWTLPAMSVNPAGSTARSRSKARTSIDAVWARVKGSSGQYRSGPIRHPTVAPNSARRSTWRAHHKSLSVSANRERVKGPGSPPSSTRTTITANSQRVTDAAGHSRPAPQPTPSSTPCSNKARTPGSCTEATSSKSPNTSSTPAPGSDTPESGGGGGPGCEGGGGGAACVIDPATGEPLSRPGEEYSRAVEYAIDAANGEAVFVRDHSLGGLRSVLGAVGGHVEALSDGAWLVSWGRLRGAHAGDEAPAAEDAAVSIVDPSTGAESFAILRSGLVAGIRELRALPVDRGAFDAAPAPLTAAFTDTDPVLRGPVAGGAPDGLTLPDRAGAVGVAVAFSRPVAAFAADTPSIEVVGGRLVASAPRIEFGKPANSHILAIAPDGPGPVTVRLVGGVPCDEGGVCTADGARLSGPGAHWSWSVRTRVGAPDRHQDVRR